MAIFLDDRNRLPHSVEPELEALRNAGCAVELTIDNDLVVEAVLPKGGEVTLVQWFDDEETCDVSSRPGTIPNSDFGCTKPTWR